MTLRPTCPRTWTPITTLGFQPEARLDEGELWPVAFAVNSH